MDQNFDDMFCVYDKATYERYKKQHLSKLESYVQKEHYSYFKGKNILDVAFGSGRFMMACPKDKVFGIEMNKSSVKELKSFGYKVVCGDILNLPFKEHCFDGINCCDVMEHFFPFQLRKLFQELYRVTKEGADILIKTNTPQTVWTGIYHIRPYEISAIKALLDDSGFQIVRYWYIGSVRGRILSIPFRVLRRINCKLYLSLSRIIGKYIRPLRIYIYVLAKRKFEAFS